MAGQTESAALVGLHQFPFPCAVRVMAGQTCYSALNKHDLFVCYPVKSFAAAEIKRIYGMPVSPDFLRNRPVVAAETIIEGQAQNIPGVADMGSAEDACHPALTVMAFTAEIRGRIPEPAGAGSAVMTGDADDSARGTEREVFRS